MEKLKDACRNLAMKIGSTIGEWRSRINKTVQFVKLDALAPKKTTDVDISEREAVVIEKNAQYNAKEDAKVLTKIAKDVKLKGNGEKLRETFSSLASEFRKAAKEAQPSVSDLSGNEEYMKHKECVFKRTYANEMADKCEAIAKKYTTKASDTTSAGKSTMSQKDLLVFFGERNGSVIDFLKTAGLEVEDPAEIYTKNAANFRDAALCEEEIMALERKDADVQGTTDAKLKTLKEKYVQDMIGALHAEIKAKALLNSGCGEDYIEKKKEELMRKMRHFASERLTKVKLKNKLEDILQFSKGYEKVYFLVIDSLKKEIGEEYYTYSDNEPPDFSEVTMDGLREIFRDTQSCQN